MNTKIAFFDIDGTLINVPHGLMKPTQATIHALNEFKKMGNKIVIATARKEAPQSVQEIDFDGYICSDGHYICFDNEILIDELFNEQQITKQLQVYQKHHGRSLFSGHNSQWCAYLDDPLIIKHREMFSGTTQRPTDVQENFKAHDIHAISCCVLFETVDDLWAAYHELENEFTMVPYDKGLIRMDVYCQGFTKGTACEYLYKKLNIDFKNTYAFGDGVNDMQMLKLVYHGIAMGNAVEELKSMALEVTDTVDNDGIAQFFKKHFQIDQRNINNF